MVLVCGRTLFLHADVLGSRSVFQWRQRALYITSRITRLVRQVTDDDGLQQDVFLRADVWQCRKLKSVSLVPGERRVLRLTQLLTGQLTNDNKEKDLSLDERVSQNCFFVRNTVREERCSMYMKPSSDQALRAGDGWRRRIIAASLLACRHGREPFTLCGATPHSTMKNFLPQ